MTDRLQVPLSQPAPDCERFIRAVTTDYQPPRPPLVEYIVDRTVMEPVLAMMGRRWADAGADRQSQKAHWDNFIAFWHGLGYDFVRLELSMGFPLPVSAKLRPRTPPSRDARGNAMDSSSRTKS